MDACRSPVVSPTVMSRLPRRLIPAAILASLLLAGTVSASPPVSARPYKVLSGLKLTGEVKARLVRLARRYHKKTGYQLVVTSGTRTPSEQAVAMYAKLRRRHNLLRLYRRTALARQVIRAYRKARRARKGRQHTIRAMAKVLRAQVARGEYLSQHLRDGAVDIRSFNLSRRHKRIFRRLVRKERDIILIKEERYPPHFHLEVYTPASPRPK